MAPEKELQPISDPKIIDRYLRYSFDFKELATCSTEPENYTFDAKIAGYEAESYSLDLEILDSEFASLHYEAQASLDAAEKPIRVSFAVNDVLFFAHARITKRDQKLLTISIDQPVFKLQRREAVRIRVTDEFKASVEFNKQKYTPHDLSAGGLSLVMAKEDTDRFPKGAVFKGAKLAFGGKEYATELEATGAHPLRKGNCSTWKVGFRFRVLPAMAENAIAKEAYLHTQKIWARWL
jgi:c-di-GMP-binding flagellar brake protein YcgR